MGKANVRSEAQCTLELGRLTSVASTQVLLNPEPKREGSGDSSTMFITSEIKILAMDAHMYPVSMVANTVEGAQVAEVWGWYERRLLGPKCYSLHYVLYTRAI